jgi:hypothetical protein
MVNPGKQRNCVPEEKEEPCGEKEGSGRGKVAGTVRPSWHLLLLAHSKSQNVGSMVD